MNTTRPHADDCAPEEHAHVGLCQRAGYRHGWADAMAAVEARDADLLRLVQAAIQTHREQHTMYGNTAACSGGIGGAAMTQHCSVTCGYYERHEAENERWYDVERAYFRMADGDPEWADYIPGGPLSTHPAVEARSASGQDQSDNGGKL